MLRRVLVGLSLLTVLGTTGCMQPFEVPEYVVIEPSQTAFLIPLEGKTSDQKGFTSEEFLKASMVATKRIQLPHRWDATGRWPGEGHYLPTMRVIVVERKPVTREWTESAGNGTSPRNEGIEAESKESIGFMARMSCSAQIDEADAVRFLYRYNNKPLDEVMDTDIRPVVESEFVEQCAHYDLSDLITHKDDIMNSVRAYAIPYFKDRGISINVLGLKGELTYLDAEIQQSINQKFQTAQDLQAQRDVNARNLEKARTDAQVAHTLSASGSLSYQMKLMDYQVRMKELENQSKAIDKWKGDAPNAVGTGGFFNLPFSSK